MTTDDEQRRESVSGPVDDAAAPDSPDVAETADDEVEAHVWRAQT